MGPACDVLVIGGGVAGIAAGLAARAAGASVLLVRSSPGATAVSSGAWHGPLPDLVARALADAGLPYVPVGNPLPHPFGDLRACDHAGESHVGALAQTGGVLCGIAGLAGFHAASLARLLAGAGGPLTHVDVALDGTPPDGWSPFSLASFIGRDPGVLGRAIAARLPAGATHVVLPPVLGLENTGDVRVALKATLGVPVYECLGAPPSIPGWRLDRALLRAAHAAGIEVVRGTARLAAADGGRIVSITIAGQTDGNAAAARHVAAERYVLATGKFLGGGIATEGMALVEPAFGLPIWIDHLGQSFSRAESLTLTSRVRAYDQPLLKAGVHSDAAGRPVNARGHVLYSNVTIAGAVLAGAEAGTPGLGLAATQGMAAVADLATLPGSS